MSTSKSGGGKKAKGNPPAATPPSWRVFLIVAFATCHAVKMLVAILPEEHRPDPLPFGVAHAYEMLTGSQQNWNMFVTIPSHHDYRIRLVITDVNGKERSLGPLLPGFQPYPVPEQARTYLLFERMLTGPVSEGLRVAYLKQVDRALREEHRILPGESWCLEEEEDFTRHLLHIQRDGRLAERRWQRYSLAAPNGQPYTP